MTAREAKKTVEDATEAATTSCERVVKAAKKISDTLTHRHKRAKTNPFVRIDFDKEEDSLVTSIENVTNVIKKE